MWAMDPMAGIDPQDVPPIRGGVPQAEPEGEAPPVAGAIDAILAEVDRRISAGQSSAGPSDEGAARAPRSGAEPEGEPHFSDDSDLESQPQQAEAMARFFERPEAERM